MRKQTRIARRKGCAVGRLNLEPLEQRVMLASDFGDAPAPYTVLAAEDGARHEAVGPILGFLRDAEVDGVHSSAADADDHTGGSDEDGVAFGEVRVGQVGAIVTVTVSNAPAGAQLDAWIDFNGDGNWGGAREQIAANLAVANGSNAVTFEVPAEVASGVTYARFRLSTAGALAPLGAAADGEVEDHQLTLVPPSASKTQFSGAELLLEHRADDLQAHDLDRDGDLDLISVTSMSRKIQWYENVGAAKFEARVIYHVDDYVFDGPNSLDVADVDGDGDLDLLAAGTEPFTLGWLENDGQQNFSLHTIVEPGTYGRLVRAGDVDGDGDVDVVSVVNQELIWFEHQGNGEFVGHVVGAANAYSSRGLELADLDRDGDLDFLLNDNGGIAWYANDGGAFQRQSIWATSMNFADVKIGDLDGDGFQDVVSNAGGKVQIHRTRRIEGGIAFDRYELQAFGSLSASLNLADLDGDGDQDIAAERTWFRNQGNGQFDYGESLVQHIEFFQLIPADLDADGDLDLVATESGGAIIRWFENADYTVELGADWLLPVPEHSANPPKFWFYRRDDVTEPLEVTVRIGGTAELGVDYTVDGLTLLEDGLARVLIPAGANEQSVTITPINDAQFEFAETVEMSIVKQPNYVFYSYTSVVTIADDEPADWGDAPSPYRTLFADGGPRHSGFGPMLGATRDLEFDGLASADAQGDDEAGDPSGGVEFGPLRVGQQDGVVNVTVASAPVGARLDAWVDFNGDGNWGGAGERILFDRVVANGVNELQFSVPSGAKAGEAFARFRISSAGGLGVGGEAADGEVEDLRVMVLPPSASLGILATRALGEELFYFGRIELGDMDGDGDQDLVTTASGVTWHELDGGQVIATHLIAPKDHLSPPINDIELCDLDGDGDLDVVVGGSTTLLGESGAATFWLENLGAGAFSAHSLSPTFVDLTGISVVDIDSDGDLDVVGKDYDLTVLVNDGAQNFTPHSFGPSSTTTAPIPFDFDADGDLDMIVARGKEVSLLEGYGGLYFVTRVLDTGFNEIRHVALADVDGDGDKDVVWSGGRDGLEWTETGASKPYTSHPIGWTSMLPGDSLFVADVNGDGRDEILTSNNMGTLWWERQESGAFMPRELSRYWVQSPDVGDVDGDGDLDLAGILGIAPYTIMPTNFIWMENVSARVSVIATEATATESGAAAITYTFRREGFVDRALTVGFDVQGSATFGSDYQQAGAIAFSTSGGTIVFPAGVSEVQLMLTPLDDAMIESNETIVISLPAGPDFLPEDAPAAVGRIVDNEAGDFGDAPGPYPTTLADDGARHGNTGPRLGARRDVENDGLPSAQANGDDATAGDDGDGVLFGELRVGQSDSVLYAYVFNAAAGARLDAWIDFNGDGHWGGVGEHVATSAMVVAGLNEIRFAVPAGARSGATMARVRLSTAGGLGATGAAVDGEVEDYQVWIEPPLGLGGPFAEPQTIALGVNVEAFAAADLDRDGDEDLVTIYDGSSWPPDQFFWYEKSASGFVAHEISVPWDLGNLEYGGLLVADMNGDGWNDLVLRGDAAAVIMLNDRTGGFTQLPAVVGTAGTGYATNWVAPLDADLDGDLDLMLQTKDGTQFEITLLVNRGDATFELQQAAVGTIEFASAADVDGDGDVDLLGRLGYQSYYPVIGYNDGPGQMRIVPVDSLSFSSSFGDVQAVDLDGDGDLDLLASSDLLAWWENLGNEEFALHHLGQLYGSDSGVGARAADFDGDGRMDVVAARVRGTMIAWYQNLGDGKFVRRIVDQMAPNPIVVIPVDLDQDGDLDILSRDFSFGLIWYENLSLPSGDYNSDETVDAADYSVWRDTSGATGLTPYSGADGDGDGTVDQEDYLVWKANFGRVFEAGGSGRGAVSQSKSNLLLPAVGNAAMDKSSAKVAEEQFADERRSDGTRAGRWRRGLELLGRGVDFERTRNKPPAEPGAGGRLLDSVRPRDLALLAWRNAALDRWQRQGVAATVDVANGFSSQVAVDADGVFEALGSGALRLLAR